MSSLSSAVRALVVLFCLVLAPPAHAADPGLKNEVPPPAPVADALTNAPKLTPSEPVAPVVPVDPAEALAKWRRIDRRMQVMSWVGIGVAVTGGMTLATAFATKDPGWLVLAIPLSFLATPMIHVGAILSGYALFAEDLGGHPILGWVGVGMVAWSVVAAMAAGVTYLTVDEPVYPPAGIGPGTNALLNTSMVLLYGSCAVGLFQLAVNGGNRKARDLDLVLSPPLGGQPGMLLISGAF